MDKTIAVLIGNHELNSGHSTRLSLHECVYERYTSFSETSTPCSNVAPEMTSDRRADQPCSNDGYRFQMGFNGLYDFGGQRKVRLFGVPVLVKQNDGFTGGIENEPFRQSGLGGKMGQLVL